MPARAELFAQLAIVINLAVRHKPQRTVRVRERLMTAREVDDREPAHADRTWAISINAIVVRSAVNDGLAHSAKSFHRRGLPVELQDSVDSAHSEVSISSGQCLMNQRSRRAALCGKRPQA